MEDTTKPSGDLQAVVIRKDGSVKTPIKIIPITKEETKHE